ncbi:YadA C-terminal domain-containing protein, partial [Yersinia pestis]
AALNSLFQPYGVGKVNFTAGVGGYRSSQALAIGSGYRVNESVAFKAGVAYAGSSNVMYNASFNIEW